jgi:hypothetical protein
MWWKEVSGPICGLNPGRLLRAPYTVVYDHKRSRFNRIRPYFAVIHVIVLRSYISVTVYGAIRLYTEENGDCIRPPCTKTVNDHFFLRISPYVYVYDTEIYDRNTITYKPSYFAVYGRLRPCLFDLWSVPLLYVDPKQVKIRITKSRFIL